MWIDSHNHLQDACAMETIPELVELPIRYAVVNGTSEADWAAVADLAEKHPWIYPAFGLHPWYLERRTDEWEKQLVTFLKLPRASIGECGLDRWMQNPDTDLQREIFQRQLALAAAGNLAISIHCLRASGALLDVLRSDPLPRRGFLMHAFTGSEEVVAELVEQGAYFSFSGAFLDERKTNAQQMYARLPLDRLLVETDAPAMPLPEVAREFEARSGGNHPGNIRACHRGLARLRKMSVSDLAGQVEENFLRLFGP